MPTISGFTFVRNGFDFGYPFLQSIQSILPVVDELIVIVGDSTDGTREAIEKINNPTIKIFDSIWDEENRNSGKIFAIQANLGLEKTSGDWAFHLQVDEVIHEKSYDSILKYIELADKNADIDGLLNPFYHFWGDYEHIRNTRGTHRREVRLFKNTGKIFSYKDSQGFRKSTDLKVDGEKLNVLMTDIPIFHYSYTRPPHLMKKKANYFHRFWHSDDWLRKNTNQNQFDFNEVDRLEIFNGSHPKYMKDTIAAKNWDFEYDPSKSNMGYKDKILDLIERKTGARLFEYKNYKIIK